MDPLPGAADGVELAAYFPEDATDSTQCAQPRQKNFPECLEKAKLCFRWPLIGPLLPRLRNDPASVAPIPLAEYGGGPTPCHR
jgi:hypothetical protein